jgi:hypothetical protein
MQSHTEWLCICFLGVSFGYVISDAMKHVQHVWAERANSPGGTRTVLISTLATLRMKH